MADFAFFQAHFWKNVYIYFLGVPVTFSMKMLLWRGIQGASKNHFKTSNSTRYLRYGRVKFQFSMESIWEGQPKKRDFHFSNFDVFLKGEPRGIQKPKQDLPNSCGPCDMAAGSFNFIGKHEGGPNKNRNFLKFRFSDPLKAQNSPQRAKRTRMGRKGNKDTISAYYRALVI